MFISNRKVNLTEMSIKSLYLTINSISNRNVYTKCLYLTESLYLVVMSIRNVYIKPNSLSSRIV